MSGTSLDGLDISFCNYTHSNSGWNFEILACDCIQYDNRIKKQLLSAYTASGRQLAEIDHEFGRYIGHQVNDFIFKHNISPELIGSHGHTIFHDPSKRYTLQIGSGAQIAAETGMCTITDFRSGDVALGGQGAPLVPAGDKYLFQEYDACLNLGGFANISFSKDGVLTAYDICPVNFVLNNLAQKVSLPFDRDGELASRGRFLSDMYVALEGINQYLSKKKPSLSHEWVEENIFPVISLDCSIQDILHTYTLHVAERIRTELNQLEIKNVLITGGGVRNTYLLNKISEGCTKKIIVPEEQIIDFKEAVIFGFLGLLRFRNEINIFSSVTHARKDSVGGCIYNINKAE